ncbi:MAG: DUF4199 domain-containing protein, partial [Flavobacterium sp.]
MNELSKEQEIKQAALPKGLILGGVSLLLTVFSFYFTTAITTTDVMVVLSPLIFLIIVPIIITVFFILKIRKKIGGYWTFRQATSGVFIIFLLSYVINTIGSGVIFEKLIEPDMAQKTKNVMVPAFTSILNK